MCLTPAQSWVTTNCSTDSGGGKEIDIKPGRFPPASWVSIICCWCQGSSALHWQLRIVPCTKQWEVFELCLVQEGIYSFVYCIYWPVVLVYSSACIDETTGTKCVTYLDTKHSTVRSSDCELLVHVDLLVDNDAPRCDRCMHYCSTLRALISRSEKQNISESDPTDPSSHTPFRHLNSPEKARRYKCEHSLRRSCQQRIACRSEQLSTAAQERGFAEDKALHDDLCQIMTQNTQSVSDTLPSGSFARIVWDSQKEAASLKDAWQMRWDPIMVRWCLYLRQLSSSAMNPCERLVSSSFHHREHFVIIPITPRLQLGFQRRLTSSYK